MSHHRHSPDPLVNHGYTDLCSCGVRIHRDEHGGWVPDDGELDSLIADLDAELATKDSTIDRIERELVKAGAKLEALKARLRKELQRSNDRIAELEKRWENTQTLYEAQVKEYVETKDKLDALKWDAS